MKTDFYEDRLPVFLGHLGIYIIACEIKVTDFLYKECGYKKGNALPAIDSSFKSIAAEDYWGGKKHLHAWMYKKITVPADMVGKDLVLRVQTNKDGWNVHNPQFIAYVDGVLAQGLDTNHRELYLDNAKEQYEIYLYAYTSDCDEPLTLDVKLIEYDKAVKKLYHTLSVAYETSILYDPGEKVYADLEKNVLKAINLIDMRCGRTESFKKSVIAAQKVLDQNLVGKTDKSYSVVCIGHTHIDVAWLWTLTQTREKVLRSFSNVIALMKRNPEYKFMSSQAQLYKYLKEESPELYEEVKKMVKQGRWEVEGAMWVEADCNLSSGESLVRQILYGKQFFKREFGVDCRVLWLPDVFGYSAALPQILRKSGVDKFVTSKISWNETNKMPYDMFFWHGIDGTDIFTYFLTAQDKERGQEPKNYSTYNAELNPSQLEGTYNRFQQKALSDEVMITYGYGDGGGGPTQQHLDYYNVLKKGIPGAPVAKSEFAGKFLDRVKAAAEAQSETPHWHGELYLEYHRGTYTSMAKNKKYNRKSEFLLERAEALSVAAEQLTGKPYPAEEIYNAWETVLLNQFHDIIPGSSIKEVYDDSWQQYEQIAQTGNTVVNGAMEEICKNICTDGGIVVFNPNSFTSDGVVCVNGKTVYVKDIPAKGYRVVKEYNDTNSVKVTEKSIENKYYKLTLDKKGTFTKIYDKINKRQVLKPGCRGNVLMAYEDFPRAYDNWEISNYYVQKCWEIDDVESVQTVNDGVRAGLKITKKFLSSTLTQTVWLYEDKPGIDIENNFDWKESHIVVKAEFPVDINSTRATYDIQFGSVERPTHTNTSWDAAKFEVCAHKFADYSEYGYGVSLMNDCKYGYDIHSGTMRLTLLKCGTHPNPEADKCVHEFTYSLYPHAGDYRDADIISEAYKLNVPMQAVKLGRQNGKLPESFCGFLCDSKNIIAETIKKAEDGNGIVIRMYESFNRKTSAKVSVGYNYSKAFLCDMMENNIKELDVKDGKISIDFAPFEIVTVRLV